jgi:pimeloyl-ACP methyl ester carboxylesterase
VLADASERLRDFDRPALIVWGLRDKFFALSNGERLAEVLPCARLERIADARTFVPLDAPARLAELLAGFVPAPAASAASPSELA